MIMVLRLAVYAKMGIHNWDTLLVLLVNSVILNAGIIMNPILLMVFGFVELSITLFIS